MSAASAERRAFTGGNGSKPENCAGQLSLSCEAGRKLADNIPIFLLRILSECSKINLLFMREWPVSLLNPVEIAVYRPGKPLCVRLKRIITERRGGIHRENGRDAL